MQTVTAVSVKELRELTGVAMMDCKKALVECNGDLEEAKELLRKKGQAKALKKSSRETSEGAIGLSLSEDKKKGALVKLACETDFVARNESFQNLLGTLARQVLAQGGEGLAEQNLAEGEGTVKDLLTGKILELGENMQLLDSGRLQVSEGVIGGYVHMTGKIGVLIALETDAACGAEPLVRLAKDLAMHIAASPVEAIRADQVDQNMLEKEREIIASQARESGKPEEIIEKMIEGRMTKFLNEISVETQSFVKDPQKTVAQLVKDVSSEIGVEIGLREFIKFQF